VTRTSQSIRDPCYFFNCNHMELIYADDACPNLPAREKLLATMSF
jgi:hypothetical protein